MSATSAFRYGARSRSRDAPSRAPAIVWYVSVIAHPSMSWSALASAVVRSEPPVAWGWMVVRDAHADAWRLSRLTVRAATEVAPLVARYPDLVLGLESLSPRAAAARLRAGRVAPRRLLGEAVALESTTGVVAPVWVTTEANGSSWPELRVMLHAGIGQVVAQGPLVAPDTPLYPSAAAAAADLLFDMTAQAAELYRNVPVVIRLPDRRARFGALTLQEDTVSVDVHEGLTGGLRGCRVRSAWRETPDATQWTRDERAVDGPGAIHLPTARVPAELLVVLCAPDGRVLDRRAWDERIGPSPHSQGTREALVQAWAAGGERADVEFKQTANEPKVRARIAETIAAMANGHGGVILVGVADDTRIVGYEREGFADSIVDLVRNSVVEPLEITIETAVIDGRPVQIIRVPPGTGDQLPYRCNGKGVRPRWCEHARSHDV